MPFPLSHQSISAIADIISGVPWDGQTEPIGIDRSESEIEQFMRDCNVDFDLASRDKFNISRVSALTACLLKLNRGSEPEKILSKIIEAVTDPRDFVHDRWRYDNVLDYLNPYLRLDGFELRDCKTKTSLVVVDDLLPVVSELSRMAEAIGFDTVKQNIDRALASVENDPEVAITAACSTIESVCCSILDELGMDPPNKKNVMGLFKEVKEPLGLSPNFSNLNPKIAEDVKVILSGLTTVVQGIGALRTHGGNAHGRKRTHGDNAHGRKKKHAPVDARIARLSIHAASTVSLFLIETWQLKFPKRALPRHDEPD